MPQVHPASSFLRVYTAHVLFPLSSFKDLLPLLQDSLGIGFLLFPQDTLEEHLLIFTVLGIAA